MRHLREADFQELLKDIEEVRETATMKGMSVSNDGLLPGEDANDFIRRKTLTWRQYWLIAPLDRAVTILKEKARRD